MLTLDEIQQQEATVNTLTPSPLSEQVITRLVADMLLCSTEIAAPLSQLVYHQNPLYKFYVDREAQEPAPDLHMINYRFLHDRVQQAAYALIPEGQKQTTHDPHRPTAAPKDPPSQPRRPDF